MRIGIDISQLAYPDTGVTTFLTNLVKELVLKDKKNSYILFYSSLRKKFPISNFTFASLSTSKFQNKSKSSNVQFKIFKLPPSFLDLLWNKLHILPIEWLIGPIDIFISSDWTQPPSKAKKVTILYDLIVYKYPQETHNQWEFSIKKLLVSPNIVVSQKRRLEWVKKEVDKIICISDATKKDAMQILEIPEDRLDVVYPGI